jgi:hypothetical protein
VKTGRHLAALACITALCCALGFVLNARWLLPVLTAAPAYAYLLVALRTGKRGPAVGLILWWALCLAISTVGLTIVWHDRAESVIFNGAAYRDEMMAWLETGTGRESTPSVFIPQHLLHAGIFCVAALASAGAASLVMGAALMHYMSFYAGDLIGRCWGSPYQASAILLAWNPWAITRVISFVILGVVLSEPLLARLSPRATWPSGPSGRRWWIIGGLVGLLLDIVLKATLAPLWPALLGGCAAG